MGATAPTRDIQLEICLASVDDAIAAAEGGADRIELNSALSLGGLTPSPGTLAEVRAAVALPVIVLVRPRAGGFAYSPAEFRVLLRDVEHALASGAHGVAFGVLGSDGRIDHGRCREVVRLVGSREAVFHRAFELTPDPVAALEQLLDLGVRRVLTSGQRPTALEGADVLAELLRRSAGRIEILPGSGINAETVGELLARTGCMQVHASCRAMRHDPSAALRPELGFSGGHEVTSRDAVARLRAAIDGA